MTEAIRPVDRAGLYVPGGRAVYPSSVIMNVVPALVAGVATADNGFVRAWDDPPPGSGDRFGRPEDEVVVLRAVEAGTEAADAVDDRAVADVRQEGAHRARAAGEEPVVETVEIILVVEQRVERSEPS